MAEILDFSFLFRSFVKSASTSLFGNVLLCFII